MPEDSKKNGLVFWDRLIDSDESDGSGDIGRIDKNVKDGFRKSSVVDAEPTGVAQSASDLGARSTGVAQSASASGVLSKPVEEPSGFSVFEKDDFNEERTGPFPFLKGESLPSPSRFDAPVAQDSTASTALFGSLKIAPVPNVEGAEQKVNSQGGRPQLGRERVRPSEMSFWDRHFDRPPPIAMAAMAGSCAIVVALVGVWVFNNSEEQVTVARQSGIVVDESLDEQAPLAPGVSSDTELVVERSTESLPAVQPESEVSATSAEASSESSAETWEKNEVSSSDTQGTMLGSDEEVPTTSPPEESTELLEETTTTDPEATTTTTGNETTTSSTTTSTTAESTTTDSEWDNDKYAID